jgi:hypothetical protein
MGAKRFCKSKRIGGLEELWGTEEGLGNGFRRLRQRRGPMRWSQAETPETRDEFECEQVGYTVRDGD